jgi:hypothetical protein
MYITIRPEFASVHKCTKHAVRDIDGAHLEVFGIDAQVVAIDIQAKVLRLARWEPEDGESPYFEIPLAHILPCRFPLVSGSKKFSAPTFESLEQMAKAMGWDGT